MSLLAPLIAFELRQAVTEPPHPDPPPPGGREPRKTPSPLAGEGRGGGDVAAFVARLLAQPAGPLTAALTFAADRTWRGLAVALTPGSAFRRIRADGAADAPWIEDQLRRFADHASGPLREPPEAVRLACLAEWRRVRADGRIGPDGWTDDLAERTAAHERCDPAGLTAAAARTETRFAETLDAECPQLGRLLRGQLGDPPFLAATFAYFFRREVESNEELSSELMCDGLRRLSAPWAGALAGLAQALARLGSRFDALIGPPPDAPPALTLPSPPSKGGEGRVRGLADRPSPFVAVRRSRKEASHPGATGSKSVATALPRGAQGARPSSFLVGAPGVASTPSRPGPTFVNSLGMPFVWVPPGEFMMGSPAAEERRNGDEGQRAVKLSRGFFLAAHPVTRGQFAAFVRAAKYVTEAESKGGAHRGPSGEWRLDPWCNWKHPDFPQDDDHPVVCVSWNDARAFCAWLAGREKQREGMYRLPTEAEWEYACRAGTTTAFWPGDALTTDRANYDGKAGGGAGLFREGTTPVWVFPPNAWGLYDVHGNVWEWCADWYGPYPAGGAVDPQGPSSGRQRALRGGSWRNQARFLRSAARNQMPPSGRDRDGGFRVCLVV